MASSTVRRGVLLATLPCFVIFLSGCGGGTPSSAPTPSPTPAPTAAPTPKPTAAPTLLPTPPPPAWTKAVCEKVTKSSAGVTLNLEEAGCNDTTKQVITASVDVTYQNAVPLVPPQGCAGAITGYLGSVCTPNHGTVEIHNETYAKCLIHRMNGTELVSIEEDTAFCDGKSTFFTSNSTTPSSYPYPTAQNCDFAIKAFKDGMTQSNYSCPTSDLIIV